MAPNGGKLEDISTTSFGYIYHHLFLPPKLPGADDTSQKNDTTLLEFVQQSLRRFLPGHHNEDAVKAAPVAALQITEQNAGVFTSRNAKSVVLAKTLTKMSQQPVKETKEVAKNDKQEKEDNEETPDPMIVTELLASILRGCGSEVAVDKICKNTRDDVIWKDSKFPWRRSSTWLLVRVALQLSMTRISAGGRNTYKEFMAFLMAQALHAANDYQKVSSDVLQTMLNKVSRRLCKLQTPSDGPWLVNIRHVVSKTSEHLHKRPRAIYLHPDGGILELWYAADVAAIQELPLLADYNPQIPAVLWQSLLLGSLEDMKRLQRLENYIRSRVKSAEKADRPYILGSFGSPGSFGVEFFSQVNSAPAAQSECDVSTKRDAGGLVDIHPSSCRRCGFESKASALAVFVHEWPLPQQELHAQATVFELAAPMTFLHWRDLTVYLINDVLLCQPENPSTPRTTYPLKSYQPLNAYGIFDP
ncbi:hypothetical protein PENSTE_c019G07856 [Penicillium steckii]|uniref:DUF6606 domain-containing protein n=1 Tax=Penicillium steckii TaxID=303698 RepID=A0A1V6SVD4_9EURO|nr:hypothetical protein PENSTE_c019G07856 [Penicillium steckii]